MNKLSPQRKRVVLLCCAIACMSGGPVLLREHPHMMFGWLTVMFLALVFAIVEFTRLKRQEQ